MRIVYFICFLFLPFVLVSQTLDMKGKVIDTDTRKGIGDATIFVEETSDLEGSNNDGEFIIRNLEEGKYILNISAVGYGTILREITLADDSGVFLFELEELSIILPEAEVSSKNENAGKTKLNNVEEFGLFGGKKSEVIPLENVVGNVAVNNPRQVFKTISGLNIQENDAAGLQLSIGGRGLDPNRTANFNTRQNGYDISADALGYPESYYTPPVQALRKIEIVRGAASLQFGSQFGGLLNFVFKKGNKDVPFEFNSSHQYGSNQLYTTFNSVGGTVGKMNYYGFYNYKRGNGFRPSSGFEQHAAYAQVDIQPMENLTIGLEYTYMNYLSQQPGGLQDFEFNQNPFQSKRQRNWFRVNWNLYALDATYEFSKRTRINTRNFLLDAGRDALGELAPINRPDPLRERDLIEGRYKNFGNETRFIHQYSIKKQLSTFLMGTRFYRGFTQSFQGEASNGSDANFTFNTTEPNISGYDFPSRNVAIFAENLFNINDRLSITPGVRFEYIRTASDGYVYQRIISGGEIIYEEKIDDAKTNERKILLAGLGMAYRLRDELELYANFSQNYRSINFTDLAIQNPNLLVDSLLQDEKGYNIDIGLRGELFDGKINLDATAFVLRYNNRIGLTDIIIEENGIQRVSDYRTNIGDALIVGLETYAESNLMEWFRDDSPYSVLLFMNLSFIQGKYLSGGSDVKGNFVELIPPINMKTGVTFSWNELRASLQYGFVNEHFSDATNAEQVANATRGIIPSYHILDLSVDYQWKWLGVSGGINNLTDSHYFTRRTSSYPGPGIIPAQGRNYYIGLNFNLKTKSKKK